MKRLLKKTSGLIKGAPTAVVVSIAIHLLLFFVLGGIVVVKIVTEKAASFEPPPPIDRPKMDLKQPRVKVKKSARPKATSRIVSKSALSVTDFQLPDVSSFGSGLSGGIGGFEMMPDPSEMTLFGSKKSSSIGNDLEGTFYSLRYDRRGQEITMNHELFQMYMEKFVKSGWNPNSLARFFHAPQKLYATQVMHPPFLSEEGPASFGMDDPDFKPLHWCVHYKGRFASKESGRFRFAGMGDSFVIVRVNGKIVMAAIFYGPAGDWYSIADGYRSLAEEEGKYWMGIETMSFGNWFELEAGKPADLEILVADNGGLGEFFTLIQQEGVTYKKNRNGAPILPVFKTAEMTDHVRRKIEYRLIEGEADLTGGPLFNVY